MDVDSPAWRALEQAALAAVDAAGHATREDWEAAWFAFLEANGVEAPARVTSPPARYSATLYTTRRFGGIRLREVFLYLRQRPVMQYYISRLTDEELPVFRNVANERRLADREGARIATGTIDAELHRRATPERQDQLRDLHHAEHAKVAAIIGMQTEFRTDVKAHIHGFLGGSAPSMVDVHIAQRAVLEIERIRKRTEEDKQIEAIASALFNHVPRSDLAWHPDRAWDAVLRHLTVPEITKLTAYVDRELPRLPYGATDVWLRLSEAMRNLRTERAHLAASGLIQRLQRRHGFSSDLGFLVSSFATRAVDPRRPLTQIVARPLKWDAEDDARRGQRKRRGGDDDAQRKK